MEIKDFKKLRSGQVRGQFSIKIPEDGIIIKNCTLVNGKNGYFVSGPSFKNNSGGYTCPIVIDSDSKEYILREVLKLI